MRRPLKLPLPETFVGGGIAVDYDSSLCLPPDMAGVAMGCEGAQVLNIMREAASESALPLRALELGTGSGVCLTALAHNVRCLDTTNLYGLDIDDSAVGITQHNIIQESRKRGTAAQADIFTADWHEDATWERLGTRDYDVILCNPPYLAPGALLMEGYEAVPHTAVYAEGDGLAHYRFLLPRLLGLLSIREGATLITRFPSTLKGEYELSHAIGKVVDEAIVQSPPVADLAIMRRHLAPVAPGRNMAAVTISRTSGPLPPHMLPPTVSD